MTEAPAEATAPSVPEPEEASVPMMDAPPLWALAVLTGLADLVYNRAWLRALPDSTPHALLLGYARWGALFRNAAAISGLVALLWALVTFFWRRGWISVRQRLMLAGFAGIFVPTVLVATLTPAERTTEEVVLFGTGSANVLTVMLGLIALQWRSPPSLRAATALWTSASFLAFGALVMGMVGPEMNWEASYAATRWVRRAGEFIWLLAPLPVAATIVPRKGPRARWALGAASVTAVLVTWAFLEWRAAVPATFPTLLYGALRLEFALESVPLGYAVPLALSAAVVAGGFCSRRAADRQAAGAACLFLLAGYSPRSPGLVLMMVLAMALLTRACIAQATLRSLREIQRF